MLLREYDFQVPQGKIALHPRTPQEISPLLIVDRQSQKYRDALFQDILTYIRPGSILVINDTKVEKGRFFGKSADNKIFDILLLSKDFPYGLCKIRKSRKLSPGVHLYLSPLLSLEILKKHGDGQVDIQIHGGKGDWEEFLLTDGQVPLPPYILKQRAYREEDEKDYQTIFAKHPGSAATPTAGLHFTKELLEKIHNSGISIIPVELYVSLGTFQPIQTEHIEDHPMHTERYEISEENARIINESKREGREIIAVGTTALRTLESAWNAQTREFSSGEGYTNLFIQPGYKIRSVNGLITNFHTPKSTLFVLICTVLGQDFAKKCYEHALRGDYLFFSYGDAMFIQNIIDPNG